MKKALFLLICILTTSGAHAKIKTFDDMPRIISWNELSLEKVQEFIHSKNSDITVEVKEETTVPLQFLAKTRIYSALLNPNLAFKVDKTCYIRIVDKKWYISDDLISWEKPEKFLYGKSTFELTPSANKSNFTLESNIVPYENYETEEDSD